MTEQEMEILQGTISTVVYQNYENGYSVLRLAVGGGQSVTVVGTIPLPAVGEQLMVTGRWTNHSSYGKQFEAEFLERLMPQSSAEILAYLSSRIIKGIGPKTAARIVEHFGDDTLLVMEREPQRLAEVAGISREKAISIGEEFRLQVGMRQLMEFFASHHLPAELAVRTYKIYGDSTMDLLYDDPYLLMDEGLDASFGAVDRFAIELGVAGDDPRRVEAGLLFELSYNLSAGHSFLPEEK
ncbi:MAG: helix-hairpin-helix domain-containing protein, partial [Faecousia sp.]